MAQAKWAARGARLEPARADDRKGAHRMITTPSWPAANVLDAITTGTLIGMTSWTYKWFDPARDDADELSATLIKLVLQR